MFFFRFLPFSGVARKSYSKATSIAPTILNFQAEENSLKIPKNPPEGVTLEMMVTALVENYGWSRLGEKIAINCFIDNPSLQSSLKFLRKTPWARTKVEQLYTWRAATNWDPRDNEK
jgi:uncharacterized protein (DUF2132 family)